MASKYLIRDVVDERFGFVRGRTLYEITNEDKLYCYFEYNGEDIFLEKDLFAENFNPNWISSLRPEEASVKESLAMQPKSFLKAYEEAFGVSREALYSKNIEKSEELLKQIDDDNEKEIPDKEQEIGQGPFLY